MSGEETTEKSNEQISVEAVNEDTGEPKAKQMKIDLTESEPNLVNIQVVTNNGSTSENAEVQTYTDFVELKDNLDVMQVVTNNESNATECLQSNMDTTEMEPNQEDMQVVTNNDSLSRTTEESSQIKDSVELEPNLEDTQVVTNNESLIQTTEESSQIKDSAELEPNLEDTQVVTNNESLSQTTEKSSQIKDSAELEPNLEDTQVVTNNESLSQTTEKSSQIKDSAELELNLEDNQVVTNNELPQTACSISIQFHNNVIANLYKTKFMNFLSSFSEFQVQNEGELTVHVYRDDNFEQNEQDIKNQIPFNKKHKKHSKVKKELFVLDATPSETAHPTDVRYTTKFVISAEKATEDEDVCSSSRNGCFNCGDPHSLKDCLVPKDYARIAMARQKFKFQFKSTRYHSEEQQFGHLEPGKISNELRKALGLQRNEAPHFIYLMRRLGYPPGWLEEAKFEHSNLDLFDIDGKNVKSINTEKRGLDESKVVDYPGFNVPFQKGVKDDYRMYRVPPYSEDCNKKAMIRFFEKKFVQDHSEIRDVEVKHRLDLKSSLVIKSDLDRNSPSLVDLEQQKLQLLEQLNEEPKDERKDSDYDSDKGFLAIKTSCFGTPLLKSSSPFSSLPNPDNFSKDVSPVINFENLPNSTGKYEQLTDVLQKVRDTLKKVNSS